MSKLEPVLAAIDEGMDASLSRLFELLRFPSISTDPAHAQDCRRAAEWLADELRSVGFAADIRETTGHPMVVGHHPGGSEDAPHVLFYGHYDVQPVDPIELWHSDPFEPRLEELADGKRVIRARGASDDKGQLMLFVEACRAWKKVHGALPCRVTILFEGEEESGSASLQPFLEANAEELKADVALVCDTNMWGDTPAIATSLRGLVGEEVILSAASRDLHSGYYGGIAANPIHVLARILADLHDADGRVTLPGFYDGVEETPPAILRSWEMLAGEDNDLLREVGLSVPAGEKGRGLLERVWARPTVEVNGIQGGYAGEGFKTVIAAQASAKVSFRLVHRQDPHRIRAAFREFVRQRLPADCSVSFAEHGASGAIQLDPDSPWVGLAMQALSQEWERPAVRIGMGGSIPVVGDFKKLLDMDCLLVGFARDDDCIHSPNEKYDLESFHKGQRSWARILDILGRRDT